MPKSHSGELRDWVAAAQSGDKEAFSEIVKRCQDMAYGIAYAMLGDTGLAQDAAQEAFIAAYLNLAALREPAAFPGWFRRVVIKHSDRERRSLKPSHPLDASVELSTTLPDPMRTLEASENKSEIHKAIAELPAIQKQIITLFYLRDYSQKEIEEFLELPVSMIKKHLFTARKKLKGRLETMVETQIQSYRPSQTGVFASEVQYLLTLRTGDLEGFKAVVQRKPDLLELRFKITATRERHYWPLGGCYRRRSPPGFSPFTRRECRPMRPQRLDASTYRGVDSPASHYQATRCSRSQSQCDDRQRSYAAPFCCHAKLPRSRKSIVGSRSPD